MFTEKLRAMLESRRRKVDAVSVERANNEALYYVNESRGRLEQFDTDPDREKRLEKQQCKYCYYMRSRVGGACMTKVQCGTCSDTLTFGSTCVDVVCKPCGKRLGLCVHCGADIELKNRRKPRQFQAEERIACAVSD